MQAKELQYLAGGKWFRSDADKYYEITDASTGGVIARAPRCTGREISAAVAAAQAAFPQWSATPVMKRVDILYRFRDLAVRHLEELTLLVCRESGKCVEEAKGDVLKAKEIVEFACGAPTLMMGESLMDVSPGCDTVLYREPLGVFAGLAPWNFPAMIPMGWMMPLCIATGNTLVLKVSSSTPLTALRLAELLIEAGLPDGVVNLVTCGREEVEILLTHPDVKGVSFVGSTRVGRRIYAAASAAGKRVQALCEAKNHALVLDDAPLEPTAAGIINAACGCAGERCMALPVVVAQAGIADRLACRLRELAMRLRIGPAYDPATRLGPVVTAEHRETIRQWIDRGVEEGAELLLDGRTAPPPAGYENGFYLGPTIFDRVTPEMSIGTQEIFGPVLCIKRVGSFEEGLALMNANPFANGSVIYTQSGRHAREFVRRTHGGMVGVNVGIPVPVGIFPFSGHKLSFFGALHTLGKDGVRFFTETKCVTSRWFDAGAPSAGCAGTWDGTI